MYVLESSTVGTLSKARVELEITEPGSSLEAGNGTADLCLNICSFFPEVSKYSIFQKCSKVDLLITYIT